MCTGKGCKELYLETIYETLFLYPIPLICDSFQKSSVAIVPRLLAALPQKIHQNLSRKELEKNLQKKPPKKLIHPYKHERCDSQCLVKLHEKWEKKHLQMNQDAWVNQQKMLKKGRQNDSDKNEKWVNQYLL